ncbi:MAG: helix-turn-helix transcriptional regulator [Oscillibacter sp.]|nr:helix-turn-helix transcriptional regulator [Oscillibacter sp.]
MTLGEEIRNLRESQGMTRPSLAKALRSSSRPINPCKVDDIYLWEKGDVIPTLQELQALAYELGPRPDERFRRWEGMRKEEYAARMGKEPESRSPPVTPEPEPSGTVDLCMTDGGDCVRFDGANVEEAVRRFREFLEFQILPGGGGAVFVSWAGYPKNNAARTDGAK